MQKMLRIRRKILPTGTSLRNPGKRQSIGGMDSSPAHDPETPEDTAQEETATTPRPSVPTPPEPTRQKRAGSRNTLVQTARVVHALTDLAGGKVSGKAEAAQRAGISVSSLTPQHLANTLSSNHARSLLSIDPLDVTAEYEGKRVSLRQVLSQGMEGAIRTIAEKQAKVGKLNREERESLKQAKDWLDMCRSNGLWKEPVAAGLPIAPREVPAEDEEGSAEWYLRNMHSHKAPEEGTEYGGIEIADHVNA